MPGRMTDDEYPDPASPRLLGHRPPPGPRWSQTDKLALILFLTGVTLYAFGVAQNLPDGRGVGALIAGFALGLLCDRASDG